MGEARQCLRCEGVKLEGAPSIRFFRCPQCGRQYALKGNGALVDRWLSPISLVLYPILFSARPQDDGGRVVEMFLDRSARPHIVSEIRAELARPTQRVRDILDLREGVTEQDVRDFLSAVADGLVTSR